jgi:hypothetical protein
MGYAVKRKAEMVWFFFWRGDIRLIDKLRETIPEIKVWSNNDLDNVELCLKKDGDAQLIIPPESYIVKTEDGEFSVLLPDDFYNTYQIL